MRTGATALALGATVLVHACIGWWLMGLREDRLPRPTPALRIVWIERPAPPAPLPTVVEPGGASPATLASSSPPAAPREALQAVEVASPSGAADASRLPHAADLLEQAARWAQAQSPATDFAHDPLRRRTRDATQGRFAMRDPVSAQDVVRGIGQLLGGPGYSETPCPQIRRNIANAGNGSDPALAAEEIRRLQRFCL